MRRRAAGVGASPAYFSTAHVVECEIDFETGVISVPGAWIAHDCGRAISPVQVEGQIEGRAGRGAAHGDAKGATPAVTHR